MFSNMIARCFDTYIFQLLKEKQTVKISYGFKCSGWLPKQILVLVLEFGQMCTMAGCQ